MELAFPPFSILYTCKVGNTPYLVKVYYMIYAMASKLVMPISSMNLHWIITWFDTLVAMAT